MGYFDILNKKLDAYLCTEYKENEELQALLDSYYYCEEGEPKQELFEAIDRELLYEFIEVQGWYHTPTKDELEDLLIDSKDYINYFMDVSLSEVYRYFEEVDIKTVLLQTDVYKADDIYYLVWEEY